MNNIKNLEENFQYTSIPFSTIQDEFIVADIKYDLQNFKSKASTFNLSIEIEVIPNENLKKIACLIAANLNNKKYDFEFEEKNNEINFNFNHKNTALTINSTADGKIFFILAFKGKFGGLVRLNGDFKPGKKEDNIRYVSIISDMLISKQIIDDEFAAERYTMEMGKKLNNVGQHKICRQTC